MMLDIQVAPYVWHFFIVGFLEISLFSLIVGKKVNEEYWNMISYKLHPVKIDLNKKLDSKKRTIQTFNVDA